MSVRQLACEEIQRRRYDGFWYHFDFDCGNWRGWRDERWNGNSKSRSCGFKSLVWLIFFFFASQVVRHSCTLDLVLAKSSR